MKVINDLPYNYPMTVPYLSVDDGQDEERSTITFEVIQEIFMTRNNEMKFQDDMDPQAKIH